MNSPAPTISAVELQGGSKLEREFILRWATMPGAQALRREFCFSPRRRWRFDFAHPSSRVGIELDGGLWLRRGGHTSGAGAARDREKDFSAIMLGWSVIRLTPEMAKDRTVLQGIIEHIKARTDPYYVMGGVD